MSIKFPLERTSTRQVFTFPESGRVVYENPVCLCWIPIEGEHTYTVTVSQNGRELLRDTTSFNYYVATLPIEGEYSWNVFCEGAERGELSFSLAKDHVSIKRVSADELFNNVPDVHPRHLFFSEDIEEIVNSREAELAVLRRNIEQAYIDGMPKMPMFHRDPDALPYREFFGRYRDFVDRNLVACSLGYALLGDIKAGEFAKELLFTVCDRNPHGPCSINGGWGDEIGLSMARCLPAVYDMLYDLFNKNERQYIAFTVRTYAEQCYERLKTLDYCQNPGDSHAGRLPAYLGEAAMVLKGSGVLPDSKLIEWLRYSLEIYGGIFPYYGTPDGGWAEGPFYSSSYTKWFLPFFSAVERYGGTRFLDRPFYQRLTNFFIHFASPINENHPFGDGYWCHPEDAEWPGFFAQDPFRFYADRFGPSLARELSAKNAKPELYLLHLLDIFLPTHKTSCTKLTAEASNTAVFPDAGFISMHTDLEHAQNDLSVIARASRFGSDSHRHADQGSFAIFYNGVALISPSGYFGRGYGTAHHFGWLKQTIAHNAILVDGVGQEFHSLTSRAKIISCTDEGVVKTAKLDISDAYSMLKSWERTIVLEGKTVTVTDNIVSERDVTITYPLHALSEPIESDGSVVIERSGVKLSINADDSLALKEITDKFGVDLNEGVPEPYKVTMPTQWHIFYETQKAKNHTLTVSFTVE